MSDPNGELEKTKGLSRREFLGSACGVAAGLTLAPCLAAKSWSVEDGGGAATGTIDGCARIRRAWKIRADSADAMLRRGAPTHPTNGDEERYPNKIASYGKCLPHKANGEVEPAAYAAFVSALESGDPAAIAAIPLGGTTKLVNPQAAYAFTLEGADPWQETLPPPPAFDSENEAAEMAELYWRALARDVPFDRFDSDETILAASDDLTRFSLFEGVDAGGVFRGGFMGDLDGPFVSQFLWRDVTYGPQLIVQQAQIPTSGAAYLTTWQDWLAAQNGVPPVGQPSLADERRYIVTGRDLGGYVYSDFSYQAYLSAALLLLGMGAPFDPALPYPTASEAGFATFGGPHVLDMLGRLTCVALKSAWFQKWLVHRRLRPEAFGGRVHARLARGEKYPIHESLLGSDGLKRVRSEHGSWLLPMAYIGGCPCHPAYPAGHAVIAGACVTALKAFFDESWVIEEPLVPDGDGKTLVPYRGVDLTVGGELNKLASNVSLGRDWAGIHWRSDGMQGMLLGERLAIALLRESRALYSEPFEGFALTTFSGESVVI